MMEWIGYFAAVLMGLILGMVGGGGSILTVPILVYFFKIDPVLATAYSLFIVGLTALIGGTTYLKRGEVDLKTGLLFGIPSFVGVYVTRAFVVPALPNIIYASNEFVLTKPILIMSVFALLMIFASISMLRPSKMSAKPIPQISEVRKAFYIGVEGLLIGSITGFVGAGGGFLIIPALVILVGMPMKLAVGTSLFIIAAKSLIGFTGDLLIQGEMDWKLLMIVSAISIAGLFLGMKLSKRISDSTLKKGFGVFVLIMGALIILDQVRNL